MITKNTIKDLVSINEYTGIKLGQPVFSKVSNKMTVIDEYYRILVKGNDDITYDIKIRVSPDQICFTERKDEDGFIERINVYVDTQTVKE